MILFFGVASAVEEVRLLERLPWTTDRGTSGVERWALGGRWGATAAAVIGGETGTELRDEGMKEVC